MATLQADGGVEFRNQVARVRPLVAAPLGDGGDYIIGPMVEYDPVGIALELGGNDPYPRAKALLLAETFEMRLEMAIRYHRERMFVALDELEPTLEAIWARRDRPAAERRRLLFEHWDACAEPSTADIGFRSDTANEAFDELRTELAGAARRKIFRFIAEVAPADSPEAYTAEELAALNARRVSVERFAPY